MGFASLARAAAREYGPAIAGYARDYAVARGTRMLNKVQRRKRQNRAGGRGGGGRRRRRGGKGLGASMMPGIGLKRQVFDFKLCHVVTLTGDASSLTEECVIALNDPTDCMVIPAASVQPTGWEERSAFYDKARVLVCSVSVKFEKISTDINALVIGMIANTDGALFTTAVPWTDWCEFPRAQRREIRGMDTAGGGNLNPSVRMNYHTKPSKHFNRTVRNETFEIALPDTSPTSRVFLHVLMSQWNQAAMAVTTAINLSIVVRWKVLFFDRKNLTRGTDT